MTYEMYFIPANFTDAGRILGLFEIRNVIESVVLGAPLLYFCLYFLAFEMTTNIIIALTVFVPVAGFALIGVSDDSLSRYITAWWVWHKKRRILTYRGEADYHGFKRTYTRQWRQGA